MQYNWDTHLRLHRATWVQTELFLTFPPPTVSCISLLPRNTEDTAGRFRVWLSLPGQDKPILAWDRKIEGGFPELKVLVRAAHSIICLNQRHYAVGRLILRNRNREFETTFNQENTWATPTQSSTLVET